MSELQTSCAIPSPSKTLCPKPMLFDLMEIENTALPECNELFPDETGMHWGIRSFLTCCPQVSCMAQLALALLAPSWDQTFWHGTELTCFYQCQYQAWETFVLKKRMFQNIYFSMFLWLTFRFSLLWAGVCRWCWHSSNVFCSNQQFPWVLQEQQVWFCQSHSYSISLLPDRIFLSLSSREEFAVL